MTYSDTTRRLADQTEDELIKLLNVWQLGRLSDAEFVVFAAGVLVPARARAAALADTALAAELARLWGRFVAPLGLELDMVADLDAATVAVTDAMATDGWKANAALACGVLARDAVFTSGQSAWAAGMRVHGVQEWTREPNAGACPVCDDLADGSELSVETPMWVHKGCGCTQRPTK